MPLTPSLWFDTESEQAAEFYCSVFPNSRVLSVARYPEGSGERSGQAMTVEFELDGTRFTAINGGPEYRFTEAVSFQVPCKDQAEVDRYWSALTDGGEEGRCGWCKDRFGLSWQVIPDGLGELLGDPDPGRASRATQAMLAMGKLDLDVMRAAADAETAT